MGYIVGTGLGREAEGIVNPVSIVILPQGKSLGIFLLAGMYLLLIAKSSRFLYELKRGAKQSGIVSCRSATREIKEVWTKLRSPTSES